MRLVKKGLYFVRERGTKGHMLVTFLGAPDSGKSTIAGMLFAELKRIEMTAEFICEYAREYISHKRFSERNVPKKENVDLKLSDDDQKSIMNTQLDKIKERVFSSNPDTIVVCDTSPINSLLYMSPRQKAAFYDPVKFKNDKLVLAIQKTISISDLTFFCYPTPSRNPLLSFKLDANRIHSKESSLVIHEDLKKTIEVLVNQYGMAIPTILSHPDLNNRSSQCFNSVFSNIQLK